MRIVVHHEGRYAHIFHDDSTGDYDVYLRTSDDGVTWTSHVRVSDGPPGTNQRNASIVVWGSGAATRVAVSFYDGRDTNPQLRVAVSTDGGATWSPAVMVSDSVELGVASNPYNGRIRPSLAVGDDGTLYAVWADDREGPTNSHDTKNYGIYLSRSTDGGQTWSANERVDDMAEVHEQTHPAIAFGPGRLLVTWNDLRHEPYRRVLHRLVPWGSDPHDRGVSS